MLTTWNTGRLYSVEGQIITAEALPFGVDHVQVFFDDKTRGISGKYIALARWFKTEDDLKRSVMARYDADEFEGVSSCEVRHLYADALTDMKPKRQRAKIGYLVGSKEHTFWWEIVWNGSPYQDVTTQGFQEAKRRHKSAKSFWYTNLQYS